MMSNIHTECLLATSAGALQQVYRLRYQCYRRKDSIEPRPDEEFRDNFDLDPNSFSFLVRDTAAQALATVRITVVQPSRGWTDSPVRHVYGDHPALQSIAEESFVEASRLCFARQARRDAFVGLVCNMAALAEYFGVAWLVACPRVEHSRVYQSMFGFRALAAPRRYFGVNFETQLLAIRLEELRSWIADEELMRNGWSAALASFRQFPMQPDKGGSQRLCA